jgi:activator of 2-hydroxyglutaryl-CoA dehydratase
MSTSTSPTPNKLVRQRSTGKKSKYILGIDVGTTSVKLCLVDQVPILRNQFRL